MDFFVSILLLNCIGLCLLPYLGVFKPFFLCSNCFYLLGLCDDTNIRSFVTVLQVPEVVLLDFLVCFPSYFLFVVQTG